MADKPHNPLDFNRDGKVQYMEYNYANGDYSGDGEIYIRHGFGGLAALVGSVFMRDESKQRTQQLNASLSQSSVSGEKEAPKSEAAIASKKRLFEYRVTRAEGMPSIAGVEEALARKAAAPRHKTLPDGSPIPVKEKPKCGAKPGAKDCRNCALWVSENPEAKRGWGCAIWYLMQDDPFTVANSEGLTNRFPDDGKVCRYFQMGTGKPCRCYDCAHWDRDVFISGRAGGCKIWHKVEDKLDRHQQKIGYNYQFPRPSANELVHKRDWICHCFKVAPELPVGYGTYVCEIASEQAQNIAKTMTLFFTDRDFRGKSDVWDEACTQGFTDVAIVADGEGGAYLELCGQRVADIEANFAKSLCQLDPREGYAQIASVQVVKRDSYLKRVLINVNIMGR